MQHCTCKEETGADQWIHLTWDTWVYVLFEFFISYYIYLFNLSLCCSLVTFMHQNSAESFSKGCLGYIFTNYKNLEKHLRTNVSTNPS